jgi:hypothetical protein
MTAKRHTQVHQLDAMLAVVKNQVFRKESGARLELSGS